MKKKGRIKGYWVVVVGGGWSPRPINVRRSAIKYISSVIFKITSQVLAALNFNTGQRMSVWGRHYDTLWTSSLD